MENSKKLLLFYLTLGSAQHLGTNQSSHPAGICPSIYCTSPSALKRLKDCVVVLGNLRVLLMEKTNSSAFQNISFPELREVTGFVVIYRVIGLESIGQLFPNLARIRGAHLINNYGLIVHDMPNLREVGLYSLLKIDRGGVIIWGGPHTCYVDTIDWNTIAPNSRHMLTYPEMTAHCNTIKPCKCSNSKKNNYCWNSKKCQRFLSDAKLEACNPECLGCVQRDPNVCSVCRHYTYRGRCVPQCPSDTILLPDNQYCIAIEECTALNGWLWNKTCVFECPVDYTQRNDNGSTTCERCISCPKICKSLIIDSLSGIQLADKCVYVAGHLIIHVRSVPGAVEELKQYLKLIETVTDYVYIYGSLTITSLDFLPSLQHIAGRKLKDKAYSVVIHDMKNLKELFMNKVMEKLQIDRGKLKMLNNPKLCMSKVKELENKFHLPSNETDIPPGLNGYSGGCEDSISLHVEVLNETAAIVIFSPRNDSFTYNTVLYARVPTQAKTALVPEVCSEQEWLAIHATENKVLLTSLRPASTYAVSIESFMHSKDPLQTYLTRTTIVNFTTPFLKPEPPFIQELVASSPNKVSLRWVDHIDYRAHITSYQLDVVLIEIHPRDLIQRDHCKTHSIFDISDEIYSRHLKVFRPPPEYESCGLSCTSLTNVPKEMMEDHFDVCDSMESECNYYEDVPPKNFSFKNYVKSLSVSLVSPGTVYHVEDLAPFRDYRFRLRACAKNKCSRSATGVIRTLRLIKADIPSVTHCSINVTSHISVKWEPPDESNGPILAYIVQVMSEDAVNGTLPDIWCVYPNELSLVVRLQVAKEFRVRVCASTLGSYSACSKWQRISIPGVEYSVLLGGVFFSIILIIISITIGFLFKQRNKENDSIPLVDMTSMHRSESDPPAVMFSDFMPLYSVPLSEALLDY